jgi:hypothetical protein
MDKIPVHVRLNRQKSRSNSMVIENDNRKRKIPILQNHTVMGYEEEEQQQQYQQIDNGYYEEENDSFHPSSEIENNNFVLGGFHHDERPIYPVHADSSNEDSSSDDSDYLEEVIDDLYVW